MSSSSSSSSSASSPPRLHVFPACGDPTRDGLSSCGLLSFAPFRITASHPSGSHSSLPALPLLLRSTAMSVLKISLPAVQCRLAVLKRCSCCVVFLFCLSSETKPTDCTSEVSVKTPSRSHQIREGLLDNEIAVYPQKEFDEDAEDRGINDKIRVRAATF